MDHAALLRRGLLEALGLVFPKMFLAVVKIAEAVVVDDEVLVLAALPYEVGVLLLRDLLVDVLFLLGLPLVGSCGAALSRRPQSRLGPPRGSASSCPCGGRAPSWGLRRCRRSGVSARAATASQRARATRAALR